MYSAPKNMPLYTSAVVVHRPANCKSLHCLEAMHISGADCIQYINIFKCINMNLLFYILFLQKSLSILEDTKKGENERNKNRVMFKVIVTGSVMVIIY